MISFSITVFIECGRMKGRLTRAITSSHLGCFMQTTGMKEILSLHDIAECQPTPLSMIQQY